MIDKLSIHMCASDFIEFEKDYKELVRQKQNKEEYKRTQQRRHSIKEPYYKKVFDNLINPYNYKDYKAEIKNDKRLQSVQNDSQLMLFLCTGTYTGLIIETLIADELAALGVRTEQSFYLDNNKKCDIKINDVLYQIKNKSYLNYKDQLELYKSNDVYFIFYTMLEDNIYIITEGAKGVFSAAYVEHMNANASYSRISGTEFIEKLASAAQRG